MTEPENLCLSCGQNPPAPSAGKVDLCADCLKLAEGNERGVKMQGSKKPAPSGHSVSE